MTFASTSRPSIAGLPTLTSPPSLNRRTRPSFTEAPGSAAMRSTRIWSPGATRYCLPPLTTTADSELSGLGTASDCTKHPPHSLGGGPGSGGAGPILVNGRSPPQGHRLDEPERGQGSDRGRAAVRDQGQRYARDRQHADVHADVLDHLDEDHAED